MLIIREAGLLLFSGTVMVPKSAAYFLEPISNVPARVTMLSALVSALGAGYRLSPPPHPEPETSKAERRSTNAISCFISISFFNTRDRGGAAGCDRRREVLADHMREDPSYLFDLDVILAQEPG